MTAKIYSRILATGSALPAHCVSNDELAKKMAQLGVETNDEWIRTRTGIEQRYFVSENQTTSSLGAEAAKQALQKAGVKPEEIDMIIVGTTSPDAVFPSTACKIQAALGCSNAGGFDLQAVCSGFAYGLAIADSMIKAQDMKKILVVGTETLSRILDWKDRTTCVLFGDGAGAAVVGASEEPGLIDCELKSDGERGAKVLSVTAHLDSGKIVGCPYVFMDGRAVFRIAVEKMISGALELFERAKISASDIALYIPHQANLRIMNHVAEKLGIAPERMMVTVNTHGNTSAASIPLALDKAIAQGKIKRGDLVLVQGVGGGFTWASVLLRY